MNLIFTVAVALGLVFSSADESSLWQHNQGGNAELTLKTTIDPSIVYQSENLIINKLSNHIYVHISYLNTDDFGKVGCNGMLVIDNNEAVVFDSPTDHRSTVELIQFVTEKLNSKITALIPTHFHQDCIGGIAEFEKHTIPTYATKQTIALIKESGQLFAQPIKSFDRNLMLNVGDKKVYAEYFGEGHTKDNIVGYFPSERVIFGGCLIKEVGANKGYLGDANSSQWSKTVEKLKLKHPNVAVVIPGHGMWGGTDLFDYTIKLFKDDSAGKVLQTN